MEVYVFSDSGVDEAIGKLQRETSNLAAKLFKLIKEIDSSKIESCKVNVDLDINLCQFILSSSNQESINFKIDVYDIYFDLFVKEEEIVIQQKSQPIEKSFELISNYLKASVEEVFLEDDQNKVLKWQIGFYFKEQKINSIGNISNFRYLFTNKRKRKVMYAPWVRS